MSWCTNPERLGRITKLDFRVFIFYSFNFNMEFLKLAKKIKDLAVHSGKDFVAVWRGKKAHMLTEIIQDYRECN